MKKRRNLFVIALVCSIVLGTFFASLIGNNVKNFAKDVIFGYGQKKQTIEFQEKDLQFVNYDIYDSEYTSVTNDPQIILNGINDYAKNLTINFKEPVGQDITLELFYCESSGMFTADKMYTELIPKGSSQVTFLVQRKVADIRADIGTEENVKFKLNNIVINDHIEIATMGDLSSIMKTNLKKRICIERAWLLSLFIFFIFVHFIVGVRKLYTFLFEHRWAVAAVVLLFLVCGRYNGDSLAMYDYYIQQGQGNEYIEPVLGKARAIRSDEWIVETPTAMSSQYLKYPYGKYNNIIRGTKTVNNNFMSFASISSPLYFPKVFITKVFGYDYGVSFGWYGHIILVFLILVEFFMILTNKNKLLSSCGSCMVTLSSFFLWWGFPSIFFGSCAALVCAYHFLYCRDWKKKLLLALGMSIFTANFVTILYPAWQVPVAYIVIAVLVFLIHDNWETIRSMSKREWLTIIAAAVFCIILVAAYLLSRQEYLTAIMQTEYPGSRVDYGGFSINKLFNYIPAVLFAFKNYGNPSEASTCIGFFPIPMILAVYVWIRSKKKDWLLSGLLLVGMYLLWYTTIGLPPMLAKITLMTFSTSQRAVDILGFLQIILLLRVITVMKEEQRFNVKLGAVLSIVAAGILVAVANHYIPNYMGKLVMVVMVCALAVAFFCIISKTSSKWRNASLVTIIIISLVTGIAIRPINKGSDAITSKPLAKKIVSIVKKENGAKWLAVGGGIVLPAFAVACGAPTINSVNTYPNMELWKRLDPDGKYNEVYNRYAHIDLHLCEEDTSMELAQQDMFTLKLSYKDIKKTDAKYIVSQVPLEVSNQWLDLTEIYNEYGAYIYEINYK